jgi:hypothetical protein
MKRPIGLILFLALLAPAGYAQPPRPITLTQGQSIAIQVIQLPAPTSAPIPTPSLAVTALSWTPDPITVGDHVIFKAVVQNVGTAPTPAGVNIGVNFVVDGVVVAWSNNPTLMLAPGQSATLTANDGPNGVSYWVATAGTHSFLNTGTVRVRPKREL